MAEKKVPSKVTWGEIAEVVIASAIFRRLLNNKETLILSDSVVGPITEKMVNDVIKDLVDSFYSHAVGGGKCDKHGKNAGTVKQDILKLRLVFSTQKMKTLSEMLLSKSPQITDQIKKAVIYVNSELTSLAENLYTNGIVNEVTVRCDGISAQNQTKTDVEFTNKESGKETKVKLSVKDQSDKIHNFNIKKNPVDSNYLQIVKELKTDSGIDFAMTRDQYDSIFMSAGYFQALSTFIRSAKSIQDKSKFINFILTLMFRSDKDVQFLSFKKAQYTLLSYAQVETLLNGIDFSRVKIVFTNEIGTPTMKAMYKNKSLLSIRISKSKKLFTLIAEKGNFIS